MEPGVDRRFAQNSNAFMHWLKQQHGVWVSPKISIADLRSRGAGRGVVACEGIASNEDLFSIPEDLVLNVQNSELKNLINLENAGLDTWSSLIVTMIYEYLRGAASRWSSYFDVLPTEFDTLMFWTDEELHQLKGSFVLGKIGKQQADEMIYEDILPLIAKHPHIFQPHNQFVSSDLLENQVAWIELAHRMGTLIMAYAFDIEVDIDKEEKEGQDGYVTDDELQVTKGMIPLADLLNADGHRNNARLYQEDGYFRMRSIAPISKGAEIFNDYGEIPRADLLRRYGYITDNYTPYDVVEISLESVLNATGRDSDCYQLKFLGDFDILDDGYAFQRPDEHTTLADVIPADLLILLQVLQMTQDQLLELEKKATLPKPELKESEAKVLVKILQNRQQDYPTTVDEDNHLLQSLDNSDSTSDHHKEMAIQVRKGEKEVLQLLLDDLQSFIRSLHNQQPKRGANNESGDGKRRKLKW
ncbi:Ribosomal lysine N-methyltransferase 4 [Ophidiomyces ophidiicola]|nr:Ribosomal lysine N-methyltransferase 4 [Ophidiomyces ophidiicola]KAI2012574.1 Ribosomal lysine N-methyltransferase 4 [Ophidiomyces ophidiicola]KAI2053214.1 Ribosomal lysine N-methyltransferase 4 [Ophidiomyces ophidiicola]KAI2072182.1 Ribosomal lysine N-methyltransferase 4 [Ophidiomyces ophidiicola]KAI2133642.1 Ribosomal lysine N-methyltransferase 4 [Ophidiomyces ophidiicola]